MKRINNNNKKSLARNKPNANYQIEVPINQQSYAANSYICTLKYIDELVAKTNAGLPYIYWRIKMNDLYDPNPLILSGLISGFIELTNIYNRYLVLDFMVKITVVNNETFPVLITVAPTDVDQAAIITSAGAAASMGEYPRAITRLLGGTNGQNRAVINFKVHLPTFVGQPGAYTDSLQYSGLPSSSPLVNTFFNVSASASSNFTTGVTQHAQYYFRCKFSQRKTPLAL